MKNMFSPDSKMMSVLGYIADLFILNVLYTVCCIPVVTIGAAQAGLHNAARILQDPLDDRSAIKGFFRGMKEGFFKITLAHVLFLIVDGILYYTLYVAYTNRETGLFVHWGIPLAALCFAMIYQHTTALFHSQFSCTFGQLLRNSAMMMIWHPLASVLSTVLLCVPMIMFLLTPNLFVDITPLFITVYFSLAAIGARLLNRKGFKALIDHYNNPKALDGEDGEEEDE